MSENRPFATHLGVSRRYQFSHRTKARKLLSSSSHYLLTRALLGRAVEKKGGRYLHVPQLDDLEEEMPRELLQRDDLTANENGMEGQSHSFRNNLSRFPDCRETRQKKQ